MITTSINSFLYIEVVSFFRNLIRESINTCDKEDVIDYKETTLEDYYGGCWDLFYEDGRDIEGINIISDFIALNEDTRPDLERAFEEARDEEFEAFVDECFIYTGLPLHVYTSKEAAIGDARYDFINDKTDLGEDVSIYFDEDHNPNDLYKNEFSDYVKEKVFSCDEAAEKGIEFEVLEIRQSPMLP